MPHAENSHAHQQSDRNLDFIPTELVLGSRSARTCAYFCEENAQSALEKHNPH